MAEEWLGTAGGDRFTRNLWSAGWLMVAIGAITAMVGAWGAGWDAAKAVGTVAAFGVTAYGLFDQSRKARLQEGRKYAEGVHLSAGRSRWSPVDKTARSPRAVP